MSRGLRRPWGWPWGLPPPLPARLRMEPCASPEKHGVPSVFPQVDNYVIVGQCRRIGVTTMTEINISQTGRYCEFRSTAVAIHGWIPGATGPVSFWDCTIGPSEAGVRFGGVTDNHSQAEQCRLQIINDNGTAFSRRRSRLARNAKCLIHGPPTPRRTPQRSHGKWKKERGAGILI